MTDTFKLKLGVLGDVLMESKNYYWEKHDMTVLRDGHTEYGLRVHIVNKHKHHGMILDNALILCEYLIGDNYEYS